MDINIKKEDCRFFIDEEKRTIVCVIEDTRLKVIDFLELYNLDSFFGNMVITYNFRTNLYLPNRFIGKAVCAPEDKFDIELGKDIAFTRAKNKFNVSFFKRAQNFVTEVDWQLNQVINKINAYGEALARGTDRRDSILTEKLGGPLDE